MGQILFSHRASSCQMAVNFLAWDSARQYMTKIVSASQAGSAKLACAWQVLFTQPYLLPSSMDIDTSIAHSATTTKQSLEKLSRSVACCAGIFSCHLSCQATKITAQPQLWPWWKANYVNYKQLIWICITCMMTLGMLAKRKQLGGLSSAFMTRGSSRI